MDIGIGIVLEFDMGLVRELGGWIGLDWDFVRFPFLSSPLRFWSSQERQQNNNRGDIKNKNDYNKQPIRLESGEGEGWGDRGDEQQEIGWVGGKVGGDGKLCLYYFILIWLPIWVLLFGGMEGS